MDNTVVEKYYERWTLYTLNVWLCDDGGDNEDDLGDDGDLYFNFSVSRLELYPLKSSCRLAFLGKANCDSVTIPGPLNSSQPCEFLQNSATFFTCLEIFDVRT